MTICTRPHRITFTPLVEAAQSRGIDLLPMSYDSLLEAQVLPRATYVLTDFDRVHPWVLEVLWRLGSKLRGQGARLVNDPRHFLNRVALIRRLKAEGINDFTCWLPAFGEWPDQFPVFLRTIAAHRGVLSDLCHSRKELNEAMRRSLRDGHPLSDLVIVQFASDQVGDIFRRFSAYRIGDKIIMSPTVNQLDWVAKFGSRNSATDEQYEIERREMENFPDEDFVRRVFDIAKIEFGRVDYGLWKGRKQVYEINTNPTFTNPADAVHPNPTRQASQERAFELILEALEALATVEPGPPLGPFKLKGRMGQPVRTLMQP